MTSIITDNDHIAAAAQVTDWLPEGLPSVLPKGVEPDLSRLALAGHSRGGHTAFALALGHGKTNLKFSALIGLDPVAGKAKSSQMPPKILTYNPSSFDIAMPVLVIGTGLGEEKKNILFPPCAPKDVNHREFYSECKPPCYYFVTKDYGHLDMLDDDAPKFMTCLCKEGNNCKDIMRRTVAGIMVAFLKTVLIEEDGDLSVILKDPGLAPTTLDPVEHRLA
jgi:chlorophyllase